MLPAPAPSTAARYRRAVCATAARCPARSADQFSGPVLPSRRAALKVEGVDKIKNGVRRPDLIVNADVQDFAVAAGRHLDIEHVNARLKGDERVAHLLGGLARRSRGVDAEDHVVDAAAEVRSHDALALRR